MKPANPLVHVSRLVVNRFRPLEAALHIDPVICYYYVTYRCNSKCVFCSIWRKPLSELRRQDESPTAEIIENMRQVRRLGVRIMDFTGGEPLLRDDLDALLREAKRLGFYTQITTNGILYPRYADRLRGLVDILNFSLCAPTPHLHNQLRGVECFDQVMDGIDIAEAHGDCPVVIFTLTDDNAHMLEDMAALAEKKHFLVKVQPEFSYFGNDGVGATAIEQARGFARRRHLYINRADLDMFLKGNSAKAPVCRAVDACVVISPDNKLLLPCYHHASKQLPIENDLVSLYHGSEVLEARRTQGRLPACEGCRNICYLYPSYYYRLDMNLVRSISSAFKYVYERRVRLRVRHARAESAEATRSKQS